MEKQDTIASEKKPNKIVETVKGVIAKIRTKFAKKADSKDGSAVSLQTEKEETFEMPELYLPETTEDLVWLLKKMPEGVLSGEEKKRIAKCMSFSDKHVREVMTPRDQIVFVHENDFMGPLTLDRLYKSGLEHFPVMDTRGGIAGVLHTSSLNSLEIRETDRASSYVDTTVYYMRDNYTLPEALAAFVRTNSYFFLVVNQGVQVVGLITFRAIIEALAGDLPQDDFSQDTDLMAVVKRGFSANSYYGSSAFKPEYRPGSAEYKPVSHEG